MTDLGGTAETRDGLTPEMMLRLNRHCDRRESQWRAASVGLATSGSESTGQPVSLQEFLETVPAEEHVFTAPELVLIDLAYLVERRLSFSIDSFQQQVPWIDPKWLSDQLTRSMADKKFAPVQNRESKKQTSTPGSTPAAIASSQMHGKAESPLDAPDVHQLGDYLITGTIGSGGMGHVYRAVHKIMGRVVAIKTMQKARANDLPARRRFEREVQVLAKLSHPNIVTAFDAREHDDVLYLVTELIEGEDLSKLIARKGRIRPREAMFFIWQAAKGLAYAHQQGIIHRDIKPGNLILEKKRIVKVLDLGLARLRQVEIGATEDSTLTDSCRVLGTARYMAPEQARSAMTADERADIYSLGCTLYFVLMGQPPFRGATEIDTILAHSQEPTPELPQEIAGRLVPDGLRELTRIMMAKLPEDRPQSMSIVVETLENLIRHEQDKTSNDASLTSESIVPLLQIDERPMAAKNMARQRQRRQLLGWSTGAGALAILGGWYFWPRGDNNESPNPIDVTPVESIGLLFDGRSNYVEVMNFDREVQVPFLLHVVATPRVQRGPTNLISWTGRNWAALSKRRPNRSIIPFSQPTQAFT
ncbi:MAG: serine/threonine-protein kinase [Pirellulaceae bacterium]|nr:serine/threonine-protein kinase [Pirellulaceae bacterium]